MWGKCDFTCKWMRIYLHVSKHGPNRIQIHSSCNKILRWFHLRTSKRPARGGPWTQMLEKLLCDTVTQIYWRIVLITDGILAYIHHTFAEESFWQHMDSNLVHFWDLLTTRMHLKKNTRQIQPLCSIQTYKWTSHSCYCHSWFFWVNYTNAPEVEHETDRAPVFNTNLVNISFMLVLQLISQVLVKR